ncbi:hypothetical protein CD117_02935 [Mammaliicoccus sciuri]|uniref:Uncharacterized protein n=1 Tax=Mammaliicoccus sciuri TaxID=1296 RepID=A0AAJ4SJ48_MAMSC|nr:hypothetical protein [Mammaliicoccus sciuri]RTX74377.1 hypothetical protein CD117_02935 [Mammaliicoccus sciuri]
MNEIVEDFSIAAWNFITLIISITLFFFLKHSANSFVSQYGSDVNVRNLFKQGYVSDTATILSLTLITIIFFVLTIFIALRMLSITALIQIVVSLIFIFLTFSISVLPFLGTLLLIIVGGLGVFFVLNNID